MFMTDRISPQNAHLIELARQQGPLTDEEIMTAYDLTLAMREAYNARGITDKEVGETPAQYAIRSVLLNRVQSVKIQLTIR